MKEKLQRWLKNNRVVLFAAFLFWMLGLYMGSGGAKQQPADPHAGHKHAMNSPSGGKSKPKKAVTWTCSMHPQIQMPKPGKCPICFMDLIPMSDDSGGVNPKQITLSVAGKALAGIRTSTVERRPVFMDVSLLGRVAYDETRIKSITAWVPGRLERLFVDYTGVKVRRGDHLVRIYSPELLSAQQELLQAQKAYRVVKRSKQGGLVLQTSRLAYQSSRRKLELLGLRGWQLQRILRRGKPSVRVNIYAPMGGIVIKKKAMEGMYVKTGSPIYTIADLSQVWIRFDAFEQDLPWLHVGQDVTFKTQATPGHNFTGKIVYIDPILNPKTRTVSVRVNAKNTRGLLKPEMFVKGQIHVALNADGYAQKPKRQGKWICPMHPEIVRKKRVRCPICGMRLERIGKKGHKHGKSQDPIVIPSSAPLLTGKRAVVYVEVPKKKKPTYEGREIVIGPRAGRYYVVLKGLKIGEKVVTEGAFRLDSELQLKARPSMMSSDYDDSAAKKKKKKIKRLHVSAHVTKSLVPLYTAYFSLHKALTVDDSQAAKKALKSIGQFVRKRLSVKGKEGVVWGKLRSRLYDAVKKGIQAKKLATQRVAFEIVSKAMIELDRQIGHKGMKAYHLAFCPMAFNNKGAFWLQQQKDILNPYFGQKMLKCGSIKDSFEGREGQPVKASRRFLRRLNSYYTPYLKLQDALFRDKFKEGMVAVKQLHRASTSRLYRSLRRDFRRRFRVLQKSIRQDSEAASKAKDLKSLRVSFDLISKDFLRLVYIFGHSRKKELYETFCPMAFNNRGASWLQAQDRQVHNPYFGAKMAFCGSFRRKFIARKR